jgi:hypothetical protein
MRLTLLSGFGLYLVTSRLNRHTWPLFEGRTLWPLHDPIWKCRAPLKFKLFAMKVVWNRCWTGDRRFRHALTNDDSCTFCLQHSETIEHLLLQCPFSRSIWFEVLRGLARSSIAPSAVDELLDWWPQVLNMWPSKLQPQARSIFVLVLRSIWIERINRIFQNKVNDGSAFVRCHR